MGLATAVAEDGLSREDVAAYAVPLLSYDSNLLFGYGGFGQVVLGDGGQHTPYVFSTELQLYWTTGGYRNHYLRFDLPQLLGSRFRWELEARSVRWSRAPYMGIGSDAPRRDDVDEEYYLYRQERNLLKTKLRYALVGDVELLVMFDIRSEIVSPYADSLLVEDQPLGFDGGRYAWLALGGIWDARDNEIDSRRGHSLDASVRTAQPWLGSDFTVYGANARWRGYHSPTERITLAAHVMGDVSWGEPFFNQAYAGGMGRGVVGGRWMLKGMPEERYRGDGLVVVMPELRWTFWAPTIRRAPTRFMLVPFVDALNIWTWEEFAVDPKLTAGTGLRINVKDLIVFRADVGAGYDEYARDPRMRPQVQVYVLSNHPF